MRCVAWNDWVAQRAPRVRAPGGPGSQHTLAGHMLQQRVAVVRACEISRRIGLVGVKRAFTDVMLGTVMFGDVVPQIFRAGVPMDLDVLVTDLIRDPKVAHFHCARALALDCVIGNANGSAVVAMDGCGRLGVTHFFKGDAQNLGVFGVEEQGPKFCFGSGSGYKFEDGANSVDCAIEPDGFGVLR